MKRVRSILWTLLWAHLGFFAGYTAYGYWHYKANPGLYALQSAPWYTGVMMLGLYTLAAVAILAGILVVIGGRIKKRE